MILSQVRNHIRDKRQVALSDLTTRFDVDEEAMRGMLDHLIGKGRVHKADCSSGCGGGCAYAGAEIYEWVDKTRDLSDSPCSVG